MTSCYLTCSKLNIKGGVEGGPRDLKQVQNLASRMAREGGVKDDLYEMFCLARENPRFVLNLQFASSVNVVVAHPSMIEHVNDLLDWQSRRGRRVVFHYDTTYDVGGFFVSTLSLRHPFLTGEKILIASNMIHEEDKYSDHLQNFDVIVTHIPLLDSEAAVIVSDRAKAIKAAVASKAGKAIRLFCWNHMRRVR